jgi:catechol 2,3-dioxygenase-like lactoylglutathione lyase family enzyme
MKDAQIRSEAAIATPAARGVDMKLEVVVIPVSDVDRAKHFYGGLGWRLDADITGDEFHVIQFTPPGSPCSIVFGSGVTPRLYARIELDVLGHAGELVVSDIVAARAELADRGVDVSEVYHYAGREGRVSGPDPERRSYSSYASFSDPAGNRWLLQEVTARLPGRVDAEEPHLSRRPSSRPRSGVRPWPMASTRSGQAVSVMRTGRTGTLRTSCRSRRVRSCRCED